MIACYITTISDPIKETYRKSCPVLQRDMKLQSTHSLPTDNEDQELTPFRKSNSMKIALKEEEGDSLMEFCFGVLSLCYNSSAQLLQLCHVDLSFLCDIHHLCL